MLAAFSPRIAATLARTVLDAYADFEQRRPRLPRGFELMAELDADAGLGVPENFGFVARGAAGCLVALRGTDSCADLISDAEVEHAPPPFDAGSTRCEAGAVRLYAGIRPALRAALGRAAAQPLRVVGHSLGGAVATLLALDVSSERRSAPLSLFTFGSTRVGDWRFSRRFRSAPLEAWRVVNCRDLVPHWPPAWLGYRHVGRREPVRFEDARGPLANHSMQNYCRALERMAGGAEARAA